MLPLVRSRWMMIPSWTWIRRKKPTLVAQSYSSAPQTVGR